VSCLIRNLDYVLYNYIVLLRGCRAAHKGFGSTTFIDLRVLLGVDVTPRYMKNRQKIFDDFKTLRQKIQLFTISLITTFSKII